MIYLALIEAAMRYKESFWRDDVENYKETVNLSLEAHEKEIKEQGKSSPIARRNAAEKKAKALVLDYQHKITKFNNEAYKEIESVTKTFSDKAATGFDNYAASMGLILEEFVEAKNTKDIILLCKAYNMGLMDDVLNAVKSESEKERIPPQTESIGARTEKSEEVIEAPLALIKSEEGDV